MSQRNKNEHIETRSHVKGRGANLAVVSLLLSILVIPVMAVSIRRIETIQNRSLQTCLLQETKVYKAVHSFCGLLPGTAVLVGVLALMRGIRGQKNLPAILLATAGISVSVTVFIVYWYNLLSLA